MPEIGESLVAAWYQYVADMTLVVGGVMLEEQGELDVLAVNGTHVIGAEVATHVLGLNYGGYDTTARKVEAKVRRAQGYLEAAFPTLEHTVAFWSPSAPPGVVARLEQIEGVELVVNEGYTERVQQLIRVAHRESKATSNDAFRLLQVLTRLKGDLSWSKPRARSRTARDGGSRLDTEAIIVHRDADRR